MRVLKRGIAAVLLVVAHLAAADGGFVYVASGTGGEIVIFDVDQGGRAQVPVSGGSVAGIFPTPGGKFVFVTYRDSDLISVIDAESQTEHRTFTLAEGRAENITFTPLGHSAYVRFAGSRVVAYDHSRSELVRRQEFDKGSPGAPILFNRRGTRFYRSTDAGLSYYLETTHEEIKKVRHREGAALWRFTPDFRFLWGVGLDSGKVLIVDERKGRVAETLQGDYAPLAPIVTDQYVFLVTAAGDQIRVVGTRSRREEKSVDVPGGVRGWAYDGAGSLWVTTADQVLVIRIGTLAVKEVITIDGDPAAIAYGTFQPGEGFACF